MKLQQLQHLLQRVSHVANHDFCPNCNWLIDWLKTPLGWVICAVVFSLLVGLWVGPQGYTLAFVFLALLVLGLSWPWLSMKGIHCQLVMPDRRVEENEELEFVLRVKNFWPLPVFGMMIKGDFLQDCDGGDEPVAFSLKRIKAWSETEFRVPITPRRRGQLPTGEVSVASGFPFGLMDISKTVDAARPTLVWPSSVPLEGFPVSVSTRLCLQGALSDRVGNDGDSIGVRDYRHGDRLRNIHWAQSVRSQKLMVRERQSISSTGATVVLDLSPCDHNGDGIDSSFEWSIRIAASICSHLHESHSPVRVVCLGLPSQTREDNRNGLRPIMDCLAKLPTFANALKLAESAKTQSAQGQQSASIYHQNVSSNDRVFLVGSSKSMRLQSGVLFNRKANVTAVIVDSDGFKSEGELPPSKGAAASTSKGPSCKSKTIFVASPQSAGEELASGWSRSFSDAA